MVAIEVVEQVNFMHALNDTSGHIYKPDLKVTQEK